MFPATPSDAIRPRRKPRRLRTILTEARLERRWRANAWQGRFDYDWSAIPYNRIALVNLLLSGRPQARYLEIGCAGDELFRAVMAPVKIGVDPARGGTHRMTSDAFFASWEGEGFDVIFVDGLHLYDQVRRDLVNALKWLKPGGWIALHDMLPRDWKEEHVPQIQSRGWTGDGWKCAFEIAATPGLSSRLIAMDHGISVVRPREPGCLLADRRAELADRRFAFLEARRDELPLVEWAEGLDWIRTGGV